jgi:hypothetical protein
VQVGEQCTGLPPAPDPFGFAALVKQQWPDLRLSHPHPDYGIDFTVLLPSSQAVEGAPLQLQLHDAKAAANE